CARHSPGSTTIDYW
nr:immunoglobulin heavy chain junction region [Macaca mulatta]MOX91677.1 immunoglobulin heavy chain junction region [Macaca mulatta]MOX91734.1 immunoglobulin heavy chain junction region [Macaca mulatta]MOX92149.1 immunoglobulin heavy chain junction region [Macaca mulatta]MOX92810.1 immunoglobulin heavy chain junction region [Macaca mulatta]